MFKNATRLTPEMIATVAKVRMKSGGILAYRVILVLIAILFISWGVTSLNSFDGIAYLVLAAICLITSLWGMTALVKGRSMRTVNFDDVRTYVLNDANITCGVSGVGVSETANIAYARFDQLIVGAEALFLRLSQGKQYLVLSNEGFTEGTAEEAARFMESKGIKTIWSYEK